MNARKKKRRTLQRERPGPSGVQLFGGGDGGGGGGSGSIGGGPNGGFLPQHAHGP